MSVVYFVGMSLAPNIPILIVAEISYGISLSIMSASFFSWISNLIASIKGDIDLTFENNFYKHKAMSNGSFMSAFTASVLPVIFVYLNYDLKYLFIFSATSIGVIFILIAFVKVSEKSYVLKNNSKEEKRIYNIRFFYQSFKNDTKVKNSTLITLFIYIAMVPVYQLWQPFFQEKLNLKIDNDLVIYYVSFIGFLTFISQWIFNKIPKKFYSSSFLILLLYAPLAFLSLFFSSLLNNYVLVIVFYILFQGFSSVVIYSKDNYILSQYETKSQSIIGIFDSISRVISIVYSLAMVYLLNYISINYIFIISSVCFLIIFVLSFKAHSTIDHRTALNNKL